MCFGLSFFCTASAQPVPNFRANGLDGEPRLLSDFRGRIVILEWVNFRCPFVTKYYKTGAMQRLQARAEREGATWFSMHSLGEDAVGFQTPKEIKAERDKWKAVPAGSLLDPRGVIATAYGIERTPAVVIIDPKGNLLYRGAFDQKRGWRPGDVALGGDQVSLILDQLRAGKQPRVQAAEIYGCRLRREAVER